MTYRTIDPSSAAISVSPLPPPPELAACSSFIFFDPAPLADPSSPGWPLRNLLGLV
jgi:hypothetical protein